jgi:glycosyltransferase involved in cell wall biosynthesis
VSDDLEILCIGDRVADIDPCHEIITDYKKKYPGKVQLHLQNGRGIGGARNLGLDLASGEYIMFCDADDYVSYDILEKCTIALDEYKADFVCAGFERVAESGKMYSKEMSVKDVSVVELTPLNIPRLAFIYTAPWGKLFRRELIGESRFTDDPICAYEDLMFHLSVYPKANKYVQLPEALYKYIVYPQSSISTASQNRTQTFRKDLTAMKQQYSLINLSVNKSDAFFRMLDIIAMIHAGIADAHRSAEDPSVNIREFCKGAKSYLSENFPNWRRIKLRPYGKFTLRCKMVWIAKNAYKMNMFWILVKVYNRLIKTLHIDMKW